MTDRPILFSAPMVKALLDGRKSQTRRIIKFPGVDKVIDFVQVATELPSGVPVFEMKDADGRHMMRPAGKDAMTPHYSPRFAKGDRLWVRENLWLYGRWRQEGTTPKGRPRQTLDLIGKVAAFEKPADIAYYGGKAGFAFRPGIHLPRWASRLTLTVTDVRVERLQECSMADAIAEGIERRSTECSDGVTRALWLGVPECGVEHAVTAYSHLWDSINNPRGLCADDAPNGWAANPWIVAVSFSVERRNIDAARAA